MRGSLNFEGKTVRCAHLSSDPESRDVLFSRFKFEEDDFEDILFLQESRLFVPGDGSLEFSGYHLLDENRFELVTALFFPAGGENVLLHDLYSEKRGGRRTGEDGSIKE
jgi:hypothetical protein